ncbi:MAG: COG4315 family predicted lipoprotein [Pseudonocardiaceae bacterium]
MIFKNLGRRRLEAIVVAAGVALVVAGCGSAASSKSGTTSTGTDAAATASSAAVKTVKGPQGTYLVGPSGRALYLWAADSNNKSHCSGACASVWPPLTVKGAPTAAGQAHASMLETISGHGGQKQVAYHGHPLYYYAGDSHAGTTAGQGSDGFGAKWWLVSPSGTAITGSKAATGGSSSAPSPSTSSGSSNGY